MGKAFKTVFIKLRGRIIPIRKALNGFPDEIQKIKHAQNIRGVLRNKPSAEGLDKKIHAVTLKTARREAKATGIKIAKRMSKIKWGK